MNCTLDLQTRTYTISEKPTNIIVIGDIHGKYDTIKMLNKSNNYAIIIVAGDCGFGFDHIEKDKSLLRKLQILFSEQGNQLFFVRGNHDNPHMFNAALHDYPHVHLAADYSIINIEPLLMEILLIGGAISIDRILRIYGKSYWPDEDFPFNPEI
jgi:UDP-2,3-diacylglucosamine pyrophosphatase LpxH